MATKAQKADPGTSVCWVLCAGHVAGKFYEAGTILEGVPADVAEAHAVMLDSHPNAIAHARDAGWPVVAYQAD